MRKLSTYILSLLIAVSVVSCKNKRNDANQSPETPKALQEKKSVIESYKRSSADLVEDLYSELVEKSPELKKLETDLDLLNSKPNELIQKFKSYDSKSVSYYNSADSKTISISDSLLKNKILALINNSKNKYTHKTNELNALLKSISEKSTSLDNQHTVLKIVLTLPIIEKFQNDNLPDKKEFNNFIKEEDHFIDQLKNLTPGFK